jgi:hypothetical protein
MSKLQIIELQNQITRKDAYILGLEAKLSAPQIAFDKYSESLGGVDSDAETTQVLINKHNSPLDNLVGILHTSHTLTD